MIQLRIKVFVRRGEKPIEDSEEGLIVYTTERRKNNRANIDVIKQISKHYSTQQNRVRIVSGEHSPKKIIDLELE